MAIVKGVECQSLFRRELSNFAFIISSVSFFAKRIRGGSLSMVVELESS